MGSEPDEAHLEADLILLPLCNGLNPYKAISNRASTSDISLVSLSCYA